MFEVVQGDFRLVRSSFLPSFLPSVRLSLNVGRSLFNLLSLIKVQFTLSLQAVCAFGTDWVSVTSAEARDEFHCRPNEEDHAGGVGGPTLPPQPS